MIKYEIEDEFDEEEELLEWLDAQSVRLDPKIDLEELEEELGIDLTAAAGADTSETLGGLIYEAAGNVPVEGDQIAVADLDNKHKPRRRRWLVRLLGVAGVALVLVLARQSMVVNAWSLRFLHHTWWPATVPLTETSSADKTVTARDAAAWAWAMDSDINFGAWAVPHRKVASLPMSTGLSFTWASRKKPSGFRFSS